MNKKLRILHIFSGDLWAGAEVMIYHLLRELKIDPEIKLSAIVLNKGILVDNLTRLGIDMHVIPEADNGFITLYKHCIPIVKKERPHLIHSHRAKENILAFLIAKTCGIKRLVSTVHGLSESRYSNASKRMFSGLKMWTNYMILKDGFYAVVAVSGEMKSVLVKQMNFDKDHVRVIYNGIPLVNGHRHRAQQQERRGDKKFVIGSVGRLVPVKDYKLFLETAGRVLKKKEHVQFRILGDGPLKKYLLERALAIGIESDVSFFVQHQDPYPFYESLDVYLNTSHHEGLPLSILEAMSCGKPVVAPSIGGISEIMTHEKDGLLVKERQPNLFAESCLRLIEDQGLRARIAANAVKRVSEQFTCGQMADAYKRLYVSG